MIRINDEQWHFKPRRDVSERVASWTPRGETQLSATGTGRLQHRMCFNIIMSQYQSRASGSVRLCQMQWHVLQYLTTAFFILLHSVAFSLRVIIPKSLVCPSEETRDDVSLWLNSSENHGLIQTAESGGLLSNWWRVGKVRTSFTSPRGGYFVYFIQSNERSLMEMRITMADFSFAYFKLSSIKMYL